MILCVQAVVREGLQDLSLFSRSACHFVMIHSPVFFMIFILKLFHIRLFVCDLAKFMKYFEFSHMYI